MYFAAELHVIEDYIGIRNRQITKRFDYGYEETIVNNCRYHLRNQNIFKPKNFVYLQRIQTFEIPKNL